MSFYAMEFSENLEENLLTLEKQLQNRTYKPGRSIAFIVEKPKIREIFAADFRDRVVHHLLYNYLSPIFEKVFIYDSWACRKDKGTHKAMLRLREFEHKLERERERERERESMTRHNFYLKMDIKSFFTSIDQRILYGLVTKRVKNKEILWLTEVIIFHDCVRDVAPKIQSQPSLFAKLPVDKSLFTAKRGKGLPIGNLTSQFFANVYMNELDQFIKHSLKAKYYVRYVDDFLILDKDFENLERCRDKITEFTREMLNLTVHPGKQFIRRVSSGIDFVGYIIRSDYVLIRKRVAGEWRRKMEAAEDLERKKEVFDSYMAHGIWANTFGLKQKMANFAKIS
jgi:retron-type reverse transcriptase